jgi:hypothetical protein
LTGHGSSAGRGRGQRGDDEVAAWRPHDQPLHADLLRVVDEGLDDHDI